MAQDDQVQHESIELQGELEGHKGWVTCIATAMDDSNMILSGSRDKSVVVWDLERNQRDDGNDVVKGTMKRRLTGHNHFISDIDISGDRQFALSSSWDGTLRLWKLQTGQLHKAFIGHKKDVLSVAFSADNRQIVSGSVDRTVKVWNTIGVCQYTMEEENSSHKDWVTCVRFSPDQEKPVVVSAGRDRLVKVWDAERDMELKYNLEGHTGYVNSVTVSPDGSLCASGGKDGVALLWDLHEGKALSSLEAKEEIHALCFSPNRYWLCGAVGSSIKIWDLETKDVVGTLKLVKRETKDASDKKKPRRKPLDIICTCLAWSHDGKTLYAGYSDGRIRVWVLSSPQQDDAASDEN